MTTQIDLKRGKLVITVIGRPKGAKGFLRKANKAADRGAAIMIVGRPGATDKEYTVQYTCVLAKV